MRTYIVLIETAISKTTAISALPVSWLTKRGNRIVTLRDKGNVNTTDGKFVANFDYSVGSIIQNGYAPIGCDFQDTVYGPRVTFQRHAKDFQAAVFNRVARELKIPEWCHLRTWGSAEEVPSGLNAVLARPHHGARSTGQVIFDPQQISPEGIDSLIAMHNSSTFYHALEERAGKAALAFRDTELDPGEGFNRLKEARCYSEYLTNIEQEWRILTDHKGKPYCYAPRERKSVGKVIGRAEEYEVFYACGSSEKPWQAHSVEKFERLTRHNPKIQENINRFFRRINAPLQSFDFFTTTDDRWGIFETSPEFGYQAIPAGLVVSSAKAFIENWIKTTTKEKP